MHATSRRRRLRSHHRVGWSQPEAHNRKDRFSIALEALDRLRAGVIVADNERRVVETNRAARAQLQLKDGLLIRHGQLCAARVFETARLSKLIAAAAADGNTERVAGRMLIGRGNGRPAYVLTVAPLHPELAAGDRPLAMTLVVDPVQHAPSETDLVELFGLSPAEARVAAALVTGKTLAEIAAASGLRTSRRCAPSSPRSCGKSAPSGRPISSASCRAPGSARYRWHPNGSTAHWRSFSCHCHSLSHEIYPQA